MEQWEKLVGLVKEFYIAFGQQEFLEKEITDERIKLRKISINFNNVQTVDACAVFSCSLLQTITIPSSLTSISTGAFQTCPKMSKYIVEAGNPNYSTDDNGVLFDKDKKILIAYPLGREGNYAIPNTVTTIGYAAFYRSLNI